MLNTTKIPTYHLSIGEIILCREPSMISTILGSCVSVCLFSPTKKMGGMIHYAHPRMLTAYGQAEDFRYGEIAIKALIAELCLATCDQASSFVAKIAGGASEIQGGPMQFDIGLENIKIAQEILASYRIKTIGEDLGGHVGRKVLFHTSTSRLQVAKIKSSKEKIPKGPHVISEEESTTIRNILDRLIIKPTATPEVRSEIDIRKVVVIGASTGGTEALKFVLPQLPPRIPPILIVQHIPSTFSKAFADRLNELCPFEVKEAEDGDELRPSRVLVAPGGQQMRVQQIGSEFCVRITDDPPVNLHKPSVDYLFNSVASVMGKNCVGVILTGMGSDGAKGLLKMKSLGSHTLTQDEVSCVVYGMPKAAFEMGASEKVAPLKNMAQEILNAIQAKKAA